MALGLVKIGRRLEPIPQHHTRTRTTRFAIFFYERCTAGRVLP